MTRAQMRSVVLIAAAFVAASWLSVSSSGSSDDFVSPKLPTQRQLAEAGQPRGLAPLRADPNFWGKIVAAEKRKSPRRPPYVNAPLLDKVTRMNREGVKETVQTWDRQGIIIPAMIGHTVAVHNGKDHVPVTVVEGMVGFRFEDFVPSYKFESHPKAQKITKYSGR
mmetsp:Transcript_22637/g.51771  ORF Transcript_22637/g.51771 Transcript_22637/m.51771 type:complete len:166 (-) Transcript_22637:62-559(-)